MPKPIQFMQATWQDIVGLRHHHLAAIMRGQTEAAVAAELKAKG